MITQFNVEDGKSQNKSGNLQIIFDYLRNFT